MRAAVISEYQEVINIIKVNDETFDPGEGKTLKSLDENPQVSVGWSFVSGEWVEPAPEVYVHSGAEYLQAQVDDLTDFILERHPE